MMRTKGGAPLFVQALGLVILTLVAAQVIAIAVIFTLPPPPPEFYRMSEITRALKTGETVQTRDGRALVIKKRPTMRSGGPDSARRRLSTSPRIAPAWRRISRTRPSRGWTVAPLFTARAISLNR